MISRHHSISKPAHLCVNSGVLCAYLVVLLSVLIQPAQAQTNTMQYVALGASGTGCPNGPADDPTTCDWYHDGSGGLVLHSLPQTIFWELLVDEWGTPGGFPKDPLTVYQQEVYCDSLDNGTACIEPALGETENQCDAAGLEFGVDYCNGVDVARPDWVYAEADSGPVKTFFPNEGCLTQIENNGACPMQTGSGIGALPIVPTDSPTYAELGSQPRYGGQYAAIVPVAARGVYDIIMNPSNGVTFMRTAGAANLTPINRIPMHVEIVSGRCCGVSGEPLNCGDNYVPGDCAAAGGFFTEGATCCGVDNQLSDGVDDACSSCDGEAVASASAAECDDNNACTSAACFVNDCDATTCVTNPTPIGADPTLCCDPTTGDGTVIDDEDDCTVDSCNPETGVVTHDPIDTPECTTTQSVPTVSAWGLAVLALLLLVIGKLAWGRRVSA